MFSHITKAIRNFVPLNLGFIVFFGLTNPCYNANCQDICNIDHIGFGSEEELTYIVSYNWFIIWTDVGEVTFSARESRIFNNPCFYLSAIGTTYKTWDWFFRVRDRYESWVSIADLKPYLFLRDVDEGGYTINAKYIFNWPASKAYTSYESTKYPLKEDTISLNSCMYDILSAIYASRSLDYSGIQINDTIPVSLLLDNEETNVFYRFRGREELKLKNMGTFKALKFSAFVIEGSVFDGGEVLFVWISDDKNHIPLLIETPVLVGSIKVRLVNYENIKSSFSSFIE